MARPRSQQFVDMVEFLRGKYSGKVSMSQMRQDARDAGLDLGAGNGYLTRAVTALEIEGVAERVDNGVFKFLGSVQASSCHAMPASFDIPTEDPSFRCPPIIGRYVEMWRATLGSGDHEKVMVTGPRGTGKTEMASAIAASLNIPMVVMDCSVIREPRDFFGVRDLRNGQTIWSDGLFTQAVIRGNVLIVLDEINRASDMVGNALLPLLDNRRKTTIQERGEPIVCGEGILWYATQNKGNAYTGTGNLDAALADRFSRVIETKYLDPALEIALLTQRTDISHENAMKLVEIANITRHESNSFELPISTRQLLAAARDFVHIGVESLSVTLSATFDDMGERSQVVNLIVGKFS